MTEEDGATGGETGPREVAFGNGAAEGGPDDAENPDRRAGANPEAAEGRFERREVEELDGDRVRAELAADEPAVDPTRTAGREIREVDKHSYCHRCEHFATPPTFGCANEGTEILELTGLKTVRVADCPVVLADERIEEDR